MSIAAAIVLVKGQSLRSKLYTAARRSTGYCDQYQRTQYEYYRSNRGYLAQYRFITAAFFLSEKLFRAAAYGTGQARAVTGLKQYARYQYKTRNGKKHHQSYT
jgi:hypothetical protein